MSLSVRNDLIANTLTPGVATSGTGVNVLATGLSAWGTTIHALPVTPGTPAGTSA